MFLENLKNLQENTCVRDFFFTLNFIKKESLAQVFSREFREISENTFSFLQNTFGRLLLYRQPSKNNPLTDERKSVAILGDSLLNSINEKGLSHKHRKKVANQPGATSERILNKIDDV